MKVGVVFPTFEIGSDPGLIREFGQTAEDLGYSHMVIYDHVLLAHPNGPKIDRLPDGAVQGRPEIAPHTHVNPIHEAMVLMGFLMGATSRIGFITGVFVLPQRQAAVVAKQAAELEILRPGALRLGIGVGWNEIEFEALGADFKNRGRIIDEQVDLLKRFWDDDLVEFEGTYHRVSGAGINPRPAKTIPIWVGGQSDAALRRCARIGDGWLPLPESLETLREQRDRLFAYAEAQGRNPQDIGMELFVNFMPRNKFGLHKTPDPHMVLPNDVDRWNAKLDDLKNFGGVTHASLLTMDYGFPSPEYHLEAIRIYAEAVDVRGLNSQ